MADIFEKREIEPPNVEIKSKKGFFLFRFFERIFSKKSYNYQINNSKIGVF